MRISNKLKNTKKVLTILILIIIFGLNINNQKVFSFEDFMNGQERIANNTSSNPAQNAEFGPYMQRMQDKIKGNWNPPTMNINAQIVVKYRIMKDGSLDSYGISNSSGSQELDNAAIDALRRSAPFEALPASFNKESILVQFTFDYKNPQNIASNNQVQQKSAPVATSSTQVASRPTPVATQPAIQTAPSVQSQRPAKIRTLAVSPFGDAEATTYKTSTAQQALPPFEYPQSQPQRQQIPTQAQTRSSGTLITAQPSQPLVATQSKPQSRPQRMTTPPSSNNQAYTTVKPVALTTQNGTLITTQNNYNATTAANANKMLPPQSNYSSMEHKPNVAVAKSAPAIRGLNNDSQQPIKAVTRQYTTPENGTIITTEKLLPNQYQDLAYVSNDDQLYTTAPALAPPTVNPRRTIDIDTFADPDQLPLVLPVGGDYGQISKQTVVRTDAPITAKEINRATLPITYDPEVERVIVEEDLPPIETPTLSTGINKVAPPAYTRRRVVVQEPEYIEEPQYVEQPAYVPVEPAVYTQPPARVAPVVIPDFDAYMAKVSRRITKKWHPPFCDYSTKVVVNYVIKKNGDLGNFYVTESSGNSRMDVSATKALQKAAPFPPLPVGFDEDSVEVKFTFDYNVYKNKSEKKGIKEYEEDEEDI